MKYSITSQKSLREAFWQQAGALADFYRVSYRQNRYSATVRCAWCEFVGHMSRDGQISDNLAQRVTL